MAYRRLRPYKKFDLMCAQTAGTRQVWATRSVGRPTRRGVSYKRSGHGKWKGLRRCIQPFLLVQGLGCRRLGNCKLSTVVQNRLRGEHSVCRSIQANHANARRHIGNGNSNRKYFILRRELGRGKGAGQRCRRIRSTEKSRKVCLKMTVMPMV